MYFAVIVFVAISFKLILIFIQSKTSKTKFRWFNPPLPPYKDLGGFTT